MHPILTVSSDFGEKLAECLFGLTVTGVVVLAINFLIQRRPESESNSERPRSNRHEEMGDDDDSHDHHHGHDGHDGDGE